MDVSFTMLCVYSDMHNCQEALQRTTYSDLIFVNKSRVTALTYKYPVNCSSVGAKTTGYNDSGPTHFILTTNYTPRSVSNSATDESDAYTNAENWAWNVNNSGEALTLTPVSWAYFDDTDWVPLAKDSEESPVKIIPKVEISISGKWKTKPPWASVQNLVGKTNNADFIGAYAGQLLFSGMTTDYKDDDTNLKYSISYQFTYNRDGWDTVYVEEVNDFKTIRNTKTLGGPYKLVSFASLSPSTW